MSDIPPVPRVPTLDREPILKRWLSELWRRSNDTTDEVNDFQDHVDDGDIHFEEDDIDHENILNNGDYTHQEVDDHIDDGDIHFLEEDITFGSNDQEIIHNDGGFLVGNPAFTYDKTTGVMSVGATQLDTSLPAPAEVTGLTFWDSANRTISSVLENGVVGQHFEETFIAGQNDTGSTLTNGTVATYAGSIGNSGNIRIAGTVASASEPAFMTLGIITEPIDDGERGKITTYGKVRGIQTNGANYSETWADGEVLYKSSTVAGGLTNVAPDAPVPAIPLAVVISAHASNGTLLVRPTFPQELTMLSDVNGTPVTTDGQFPIWDNVNGYFDFTANINDYALLTDVHWTRTGTTVNPKVSTDAVEWDDFKYQDATTGGANCLFIGDLAGRDNTADNNTFIGKSAGINTDSGAKNTAIGKSALSGNISGSNNFAMGTDAAKATTSNDCFALGASALFSNIVGSGNVAMGTEALYSITSSHNTGIGTNAFRNNTRYQNTGIGYQVGYSNSGGGANCMFGYRAGYASTGTGNIYIGHSAGYNATGDNQLYIANSNTATPLLWGDFSAEILKVHGDLKIPSDTDLLHLGAGDDMTVGYDGIVGTIDTGVVAPSDLDVDCGTEKTLRLVEPVYDDQQVSLGAVKKGSSSPNETDYKGGFVLAFANSQNNQIKFTAQLSHKYDLEGDLDFHIHTTVPNNNSGGVRWTFTYSWAKIGDTFPTETSVSATQTIVANSLDEHLYFEVADPISGTGMDGVSSVLLCSLTRNGSDAADTYASDIYLTALDFHIPVDTMGSRQEVIK